MLCAGGIISSSRGRISTIDNDNGRRGSADLTAAYQYAASDASLKLSLNQIELIIRRDPIGKTAQGKIEFGSVTVEHGAVVAQVLFLEADGRTQAFLYKLRPEKKSWKIESAQRVWFMPRSRLLRGLRV